MKICHVCKAECEDFAEVCAICGAYLVEEENENGEVIKKEDLIYKTKEKKK